MAILLSVRELSKTYTSRPLFEDLSLGLFEGEHAGLIGPNGAGKSTLLKILAGLETPDKGERAARRGLKVRYVAQRETADLWPATLSVREALEKPLLASGIDEGELMWRVEEVLQDSQFDGDQLVGSLSGGWRKRLAILAHVVHQPDLLLLDEPTNHLDIDGVRWLEALLTRQTFSFLMVTHDRRFLQAACNRVIELNKRFPSGVFSAAGNYEKFLESREAMLAAQSAQEASLRNTVRREIEWLRRGPKARTTKQKARIDRAGELKQQLGELSFRNAQDRSAAIEFSGSRRQSKKLLEAQDIGIARGGRQLFGPLSFILGPGDKLGLLGGNGSGKSTLLQLMTGALTPDTGTIRCADALRIVTFDQHREQLDLKLPLRRALCDAGDFVFFKEQKLHIAAWAERFLFDKTQLDTSVGKLSGGEQARVLIARLMLKPADILLLDEPTNDLDLNSLDVLEDNLLEFPGALVLVTHDRFLLDRVSDEILALDGRGHANFYADLSQWEDAQGEQGAPPIPTPVEPMKIAAPAAQATSSATRTLSQKEMKELRQIEALSRAAEKEVEVAKAALHDPLIASNAQALVEHQAALDTAQQKMDELLKRWELLESRR